MEFLGTRVCGEYREGGKDALRLSVLAINLPIKCRCIQPKDRDLGYWWQHGLIAFYGFRGHPATWGVCFVQWRAVEKRARAFVASGTESVSQLTLDRKKELRSKKEVRHPPIPVLSPNHSTKGALGSLTLEIKRDPVRSTRYGRTWQPLWTFTLYTIWSICAKSRNSLRLCIYSLQIILMQLPTRMQSLMISHSYAINRSIRSISKDSSNFHMSKIWLHSPAQHVTQ